MSRTLVTRAAVLEKVGGPLQVGEVELQPPGADEVLVRIEASGVCHSDWNAVTGASPARLPAVLGHEGAGVVEELGPGVAGVGVGDHVGLSWLPACGRCRPCQQGRPSLCEQATTQMDAGALPTGSVRLSRTGAPVHHYSYLSTFAQHAVVAARSCIRLDPGTDLDVAALVGCGVMTGVGAAVNRARVTPGSSVAVFGAGGVGLSVVMGARLAGAATIIVIEPVASKRELALEVGATATAGEANLEAILDLAPGGVDYAFEAAGVPTLAELAFAVTRPGGTIVAVGIPPAGASVRLPGPELVRQEKVVTGAFYGSARPALDMPMLLGLYADGRLPLDRLVTRHYPLARVNQAFDDMNAGLVARGVLRPQEEDGGAHR